MEKFLAGASGATLGYIAGNIPGAYYGYKAANFLYKNKKNMKRKYSGGVSKKFAKRPRRATKSRGNSKGSASGHGVTFQTDSTIQYRKKTMNRKKKKSWRKFVKKVNAVDEKSFGKQTVLISRQIQYRLPNTATGIAEQKWGGMLLYGVKSTDAEGRIEGFDDVYNIIGTDWLNRERRIGAVEATGQNVNAYGSKLQSKYVFTSACMDITFTNNTRYSGQNITDVNSVATMEIDVYEVGFRRPMNNTTLQNITTGLAAASTPNTDTIKTDGTGGLSHTQRGVTLFELPTFISLYGVKIYKKTKFMIPKGHSFTYQKRDPKRHEFDYFNVDRNNESTAAGVTKGIIFCYKYTSPESLIAGEANLEPSFNVRCSRSYKYLKKEHNTDTGTVL